MKNSVLFCIPLKKGCTDQFKKFVKETSETKSQEWADMLSRYDMSCVKIWIKNIENRDYVFVYHETGPDFPEKIKGWDNSQNQFDQWFNEQITAVYDTGPVEAGAEKLYELYA